jgi:hypothetical protein
LKLNYTQFTDFCILCGSDYNPPHSPKFLPENAYRLIKDNASAAELLGISKFSQKIEFSIENLFLQ